MGVGMACLAILRRSFELDVARPLNRFVAIVAPGHAVGPNQCELRFRMVETSDVNPRPRVMACLAPNGGAVGEPERHAILKLALMGIGVARRAGPILKMEREDFVRPSSQANLVAIRAGNSDVRSGQHEPCILVFHNREGRLVKILDGMASLATVLIRSRCELFVVCILVAIGA